MWIEWHNFITIRTVRICLYANMICFGIDQPGKLDGIRAWGRKLENHRLQLKFYNSLWVGRSSLWVGRSSIDRSAQLITKLYLFSIYSLFNIPVWLVPVLIANFLCFRRRQLSAWITQVRELQRPDPGLVERRRTHETQRCPHVITSTDGNVPRC